MLDARVCILLYAIANVIPGAVLDAITDVLYSMQYAILCTML